MMGNSNRDFHWQISIAASDKLKLKRSMELQASRRKWGLNYPAARIPCTCQRDRAKIWDCRPSRSSRLHVSRWQLQSHIFVPCLSFPTCETLLVLLASPGCTSTRSHHSPGCFQGLFVLYFTDHSLASAHLMWISSSNVFATADGVINEA